MLHRKLREPKFRTLFRKHQLLSLRMPDEVRFLKNWAAKPLTTGAISPSSRLLARAMAARINPDWSGTVLELGPGTGAVTAALLARGIPPERIAAIEFNPQFAAHLAARFPWVHIIQADAYALRKTLADKGIKTVGAVISSLPLFTRPLPQRTALLSEALELMPEGRPFVQFSYALVPPVPEKAGDWKLEASDWIFLNLPPARIWTYRRISDQRDRG